MVNIVAILQHYNTYFWEITLKNTQSFTNPPSKNQPLQYTTLFNLFTIKILIIILLTVCHTIQMT